MSRTQRPLILVAALLLPGTVWAGGGGAPSTTSLILAAVNFTMFVGLLVIVLRKPLRDFFATRHQEVKERLAEAERMKTEAAAKYREYEEKLKALEAEANQLLEEARAEGEAEKQKIIAAAEQAAARLGTDAERRVAHEVRVAQAALRQEAVAQAVDAARQILQQQLTAEDDAGLVRATVDQVEKMGGSA